MRLALGCAGLALVGSLALYGWCVAAGASLDSPRSTAMLYDRHQVFLTQVGNAEDAHPGGRRVDYGYWPLDRVPDRIAAATLVLEDRRFWSHPGIDVLAMARAAVQNLRAGRRVSGASTLAMQVVRMQHPQPRTFWAKAVEAGTAVVLSARYGREPILRQYLRLVPYGNGSHGIAHAARFYFDKPVDDLSWAEVALLSALPQSPTRMNPLRPDGLGRAVRRGHAVLEALHRQAVLDDADFALADQRLDRLKIPHAPQRPAALHALIQLEAMVHAGALQAVRPSDPRIVTSLDLTMQVHVAALAHRFLGAWRDAGAEQVAVMVTKRGTREVLAAIGSDDYASGPAGAIDFTRVARSPGSTLKPFIYALALERGLLRTSDVLADLPDGASGIGNADGQFLGPMLPRQALANSRNVPATSLLRAIGLETAYRYFGTLGLHDLDAPAERFGLSMAIGSLPTSLAQLMRAYGALAEDGFLGDLVWSGGQSLLEARRVLSTDSARLVTSFLADPLARLPSFARYGPTDYPFPVALKTGTSQGYRDAWFVGWSQRYMVGVWVGRGDAGTMNQLSGARTAARLAHAVLMALHEAVPGDLSGEGFPAPQNRVPVELCTFGGKRSNGLCGPTLTEWVRPDEMPPVEETAALIGAAGDERLRLIVPAVHRVWAKAEGFPLDDRSDASGPVRLIVASPEQDSRLWLDPDGPAVTNRLALKATVEPHVPEVVWYVDGAPYATVDPDTPVFWPMTAGAHRFQLRLPARAEVSRPVRVSIE